MKLVLSRRSAFTLMEIMLVVMIIALLAGAVIWKMKDPMEFATKTKARSDIQGLAMQLTMYKGMNGSYPTTEQGLKALVTKPESEPRPRNWVQGFKELPTDPYGNKEYIYVRPGRKNTDSYDLYSAGEDQLPDTADDVWPP